MPLCTPDQMGCIREITTNINTSNCLPQCSGLLVTSYRSEQIQNPITVAMNSLISKLSNYFSKGWEYRNMPTEFEGMYFSSNSQEKGYEALKYNNFDL